MKYNIYISTHVGKVRKNNEDNFCINNVIRDLKNDEVNLRGLQIKEPVICTVFDGMGGESSGEIASKICAEEATSLYKQLSSMGRLLDEDVATFAQKANNRVVEAIANNKGKRGGSTFAMAYLNNSEVSTYSLGDSRIYLLKDSKLIRISKDHTLAMKKYKANIYTKEEAENSPDSHKLTAFIGVDVDNQGFRVEKYESFRLEKGDKLLLCSDGLYDMCNEDTIANILSVSSKTISYDLIDMALKNGGIDNITCLVIEAAGE